MGEANVGLTGCQGLKPVTTTGHYWLLNKNSQSDALVAILDKKAPLGLAAQQYVAHLP
ncbi:MAG: hypothetical protein ACI9KK_000423 [Ascidiaceihabitans sp.]|jgi:hypothetical protein